MISIERTRVNVCVQADICERHNEQRAEEYGSITYHSLLSKSTNFLDSSRRSLLESETMDLYTDETEKKRRKNQISLPSKMPEISLSSQEMGGQEEERTSCGMFFAGWAIERTS